MFPTSPFDYIGYFGPAIIFAYVIIHVYKRQGLMILYVIIAFLNMKLNHLMKKFIGEKRPMGEKHLFPNADRNGARKFGMPSGHAQGSAFNAAFAYMVSPTVWTLLFVMFVWAVTMWQRHEYRNHTWMQLIAGSIVGAIMGYYAYKICIHLLESRMFNHKRRIIE